MISSIDAIFDHMSNAPLYSLLLVLLSTGACVHHTSMSDPSLRGFWNGQPLSPQSLQEKTSQWADDATLIEMQEAFALLRNSDLTADDRKRAKSSLEKAVVSFDDLKQPNNFSSAFTPDAKTPYRGRPYERVLASMFLGILDMADGRCDMAIPAFKTAEFLDARWQPFAFGSDAPLVYALSLCCLKQNLSSSGDIARAKEGLFRSLRMLESLDEIRVPLDRMAKNQHLEDPALQISYFILDAGISSALMESAMSANASEILERTISDSLRFYVQVLANKEDYMHDTLLPLAEQLEKSLGTKETTPSAQSLSHIERTLNSLIEKAKSNSRLVATLDYKIANSRKTTETIDVATSKSKVVLLFSGRGPKVVAEGQYNEIARVLPMNDSDTKPALAFVESTMSDKCGLNQLANGSLSIVLCDEKTMRSSQNSSDTQLRRGARLWSSSYQATSMVGRRFDKILKGRAQFRLGTDSAALIGAAAAVTLLEAGNQYEKDCKKYGRNCEAAKNLQLAGALAGVFAGAAWLGGQMVNPRADTRYLPGAFESGYLMLTP